MQNRATPHYVGQPYKPGADFPKSGLKRCGKRQSSYHRFTTCYLNLW
ncbi:MAG: hypothetical protein J6Q22_17595 [Prevotella sp.]|nr:hypothetical protein [Prevotella sp.]